MESSQGFVGQRTAREALGLHLQLLKMGRHSGRPLLMVGPPGTGKVSCNATVLVAQEDERRGQRYSWALEVSPGHAGG